MPGRAENPDRAENVTGWTRLPRIFSARNGERTGEACADGRTRWLADGIARRSRSCDRDRFATLIGGLAGIRVAALRVTPTAVVAERHEIAFAADSHPPSTAGHMDAWHGHLSRHVAANGPSRVAREHLDAELGHDQLLPPLSPTSSPLLPGRRRSAVLAPDPSPLSGDGPRWNRATGSTKERAQ